MAACWPRAPRPRSSTMLKCAACTSASTLRCKSYGPHACHYVYFAAPRGGWVSLGRPGGDPMKQGLSLRVSQHLALTPQLQQSIRLLQLSTLELSAEVDQMLDDNPFLERSLDESATEEFGLAQADTPVPRDEERESEFASAGASSAPAD